MEFPSIDEATGVKEVKSATPIRARPSEGEDDEEPDIGGRQLRRKRPAGWAFWRKPLVRSGLVVLGLVLATALAAQVVA